LSEQVTAASDLVSGETVVAAV